MIRSLAVTLCVVCLACLGCGSGGPKLGKVTGTVTLDGKPVKNAMVTFRPKEGGRSSMGKTDENGKYALAFVDGLGAVVGEHIVSVKTADVQIADDGLDPETGSDDEAYMKQAEEGDADMYDQAVATETIPARYNTQTRLTFEVTSGSNTYDIKMTSN